MKLAYNALWAAMALCALSSMAKASDWTRYANDRFNYSINIPPGFSPVDEAENGDGGVSTSPDGRNRLLVWGGYLTEGSFRSEIEWRMEQDEADGWNVSYRQVKSGWAVWSGSKGDRIFYQRAIPACGDAATYFRIEYGKAAAKAFDPIIARLVKSQHSNCQVTRSS